MDVATQQCFEVRRDALDRVRVVAEPLPSPEALAPGALLLACDRFAFTANNITYAVLGEQLGYWRFFPAEAGWGRIPVWGYADVVASRHPAIAVGERVYGYLPMATHLAVQADKVHGAGFADVSPHRSSLPPAYQYYRRVAADPAYRVERECEQVLLQPLFLTAFLLHDQVAAERYHGARRVLLTSASSKTAIATAARFAAGKPPGLELVALTSARHREFVAAVGYADRVLAYDELETLDATVPTLSIDFAGNAAILKRVHGHFLNQLTASLLVGGTHWQDAAPTAAMPGARPELFFAPAQLARRSAEWGALVFEQRLAEAWLGFVPHVGNWLEACEARGPAAVEAVYRDALAGRLEPHHGHVLRLE